MHFFLHTEHLLSEQEGIRSGELSIIWKIFMMPNMGGRIHICSSQKLKHDTEPAGKKQLKCLEQTFPARGDCEFKCFPVLPLFKAKKQWGSQINEVL